MTFEEAAKGYLDGAQQIVDKDWADKGYTHSRSPILRFEGGKRYVKIVCCDEQLKPTRVFAFLDSTNGDILKPATYKAPAKHARGNVYDADFGLSRTTPYGPEYLR